MPKTAQPYVLEHSPRELARLITHAEREAEEVRMICRRACLGLGDRAIDVGCGPLGALATLSEFVGESGTVVGMDASADALEKARALLAQLSIHNVRLVKADLNTTDLKALQLQRRFDFAYCRLVLLHQREPIGFLKRMVELVRPGGYIAYQDILDESGQPRCEPAVPAQNRAWELIQALFSRRGVAPQVARDHALLAQSAGCEIIHQRGKFAVLPAAEGFEIVQQLLTAARNPLSETGLAQTSETDALVAQLDEAKRGSYRYWHGPLAVETLVRTPSGLL